MSKFTPRYALSVECPVCGVPSGWPCVGIIHGWTIKKAHQLRIVEAKKEVSDGNPEA